MATLYGTAGAALAGALLIFALHFTAYADGEDPRGPWTWQWTPAEGRKRVYIPPDAPAEVRRRMRQEWEEERQRRGYRSAESERGSSTAAVESASTTSVCGLCQSPCAAGSRSTWCRRNCEPFDKWPGSRSPPSDAREMCTPGEALRNLNSLRQAYGSDQSVALPCGHSAHLNCVARAIEIERTRRDQARRQSIETRQDINCRLCGASIVKCAKEDD